MSKRQCAACGADPAAGYASTFRDGKEQWFCHPDEGPSCYVPQSRSQDPRQSNEYLAASLAEAAFGGWKPLDPSTKENDHA